MSLRVSNGKSLHCTLSGIEDAIRLHYTNIINVYQSFLKNQL